MPLKRLWSSLFRADRAGSERALDLAGIESWTCPFAGPVPATPVHVVTSGRDWRLAAWMLASWCHFTESGWNIVIHDDGTLTDETAAALQKIFPSARMIRRKEADAAVKPTLREFPFGETLRSDEPSALKIFDTRHFCTAERFFVFDSDVLFFGYPHELVEWAEGGSEGCWFAEAHEEHSLITPAEAKDEFGVKVWARTDTGICLFQRSALDLEFIDSVLAQTSILHGSLARATQTLAMLCAARADGGGLLPKCYEVSLERCSAGNALSRHYTGASRQRFLADGLMRVQPHLFPSEETRG